MINQELNKSDNSEIPGLSDEFQELLGFLPNLVSVSLNRFRPSQDMVVLVDNDTHLVRLDKTISSSYWITPKLIVLNKTNHREWRYQLGFSYDVASGLISNSESNDNINRILSQITLDDIMSVGVTPELIRIAIINLKDAVDRRIAEMENPIVKVNDQLKKLLNKQQ